MLSTVLDGDAVSYKCNAGQSAVTPQHTSCRRADKVQMHGMGVTAAMLQGNSGDRYTPQRLSSTGWYSTTIKRHCTHGLRGINLHLSVVVMNPLHEPTLGSLDLVHKNVQTHHHSLPPRQTHPVTLPKSSAY